MKKFQNSKQQSNKKFKKGLNVNIMNIRKPTRGGTRL
jgi:hypothetical protein